MSQENNWWIYTGIKEPHDNIKNKLPAPPGWRKFERDEDNKPAIPPELNNQDIREIKRHIGEGFQVGEREIELVNAALYLRRPLLVTGKPGSGKSSLAYAIAYELMLGRVLHWPITTHSTLVDGLYRYDAMGRLEDATSKNVSASSLDIGQYLRLGPLGTALLPWRYPRVLLIDEIDKSSIDLPNDLLNIFEEGEFEIPKLVRISKESGSSTLAQNEQSSNDGQSGAIRVMPYDGREEKEKADIKNGHVRCFEFPLVVLTSNGEREFPPAFLRRCLRLEMPLPDPERLAEIVKSHLSDVLELEETKKLIKYFLDHRGEDGNIATDQLLNAIYMTTSGRITQHGNKELFESLLKSLTKM